jgi:hypothetical protein
MSIFAEHPIQNELRRLYAQTLIDKAISTNLAQSQGWRRLLHYDRFLGHIKSEARDKLPDNFFNSAVGVRDPEAELQATILAIFTDIEQPEPARCRFPAREIFLVQELQIDTTRLPQVKCTKYEEWLAHNAADSASIIFASFFMGNPSSMFGHTFLRLHNRSGNALLDSSFNYAANAGEENAIVYAWRGMTGGFPGTFAMHPYYVKINEYNDMESRDLWEFRLNLNQAEMRMLQAHLWELSFAYFPYYYLDENCSYQLLTLLEVVRPSSELTSRWSLFVTPTDTLHTLAEGGFFSGDHNFRAAVLSRYMIFYENSDDVTINKFVNLKSSRELPSAGDISDIRAADILLEYYRYRNEYDLALWPAPDRDHYTSLLSWRAKQVADSGLEQFLKEDSNLNPLMGFKSTQVSAGYLNSPQLGSGVLIGLRPALREVQDVSRGFSPWSQIQMMGFSLSYLPSQKTLRLEELTIVDILALTPWQAQIRKFSYRLRTGLYRHDIMADTGNSTLSWDSTASGGITLLPHRKLGIFIMAQATAQFGSLWENTARIAPSLWSGIKVNWLANLATIASYEIDYGIASTPTSFQKVDIRNVWGFYGNWAFEVNAYYAATLAGTNVQDFTRINTNIKTYF